MKQHITIEQLEELTGAGKDRLIEWIFPKPSLISNYTSDQQLLLSIGQMIEFLEEHTGGYDFVIRIHSAGSGWDTPGQRIVDIEGLPTNEIEDETELCIALWEATKELLNKQ